MSFDRDFRLQLRADLAQALGLPAEAVYTGRAPQKVTRAGLEVWIRPRPTEAGDRGYVRVHPYEVHVRLRTRREASQTGEAQLEEVREALSGLIDRYDGQRPFVTALPDLVAIRATEGVLDDDPDDDALLDASLLLWVLER